MSIESELELRIAALDPQQFERLTYDLVRVDHPSAVRPRMHDGGADVVVSAPPDGRPRVWQAKHYVNAISWSLCVSSLAAAIARYDPEMVTFVFPKDLSARELASFESNLQADYARIVLWSLSTLRARLQASPNLLRTYFPPVDVNSVAAVRAQSGARPRPRHPARVDLPERDLDFAGLAEMAISTVDPPVTRDEVLRHIEMGSPVPARYLYSTEAGAESWISVCQAPMNFTYQETVEFWAGSYGRQITDTIQNEFGRDTIGYLSLGPGNGHKDALFLHPWLTSAASVFYYPYDASLPLLSSAIKAVRESAPAPDRLRINALGADFNQLKAIGATFQQRSNPKVVALFGHSLGSSQREDELLRMAKGAMSMQDALVLEVPLTDRWRLLERLALERYGSFYFGPLAALGVRYEQRRMTFNTGQGLSAIPQTVTCNIGYREFELNGKRYRHASLAYIHLYEENAIVKVVEDAGFEVLVNQLGTLDRGFAVIVARRKS